MSPARIDDRVNFSDKETSKGIEEDLGISSPLTCDETADFLFFSTQTYTAQLLLYRRKNCGCLMMLIKP